ncbi:hypothetical protein QYF36_000813 [Acer negundo]|nr:hypothetical protein QYF36_000813 [Acer negundo]
MFIMRGTGNQGTHPRCRHLIQQSDTQEEDSSSSDNRITRSTRPDPSRALSGISFKFVLEFSLLTQKAFGLVFNSMLKNKFHAIRVALVSMHSFDVIASFYVLDCSFDATCRQFRYLCGYKENVETLRIQAERLKYRRERVQGKIDEATTEGEIILSDVTNWIERVDDVTEEAEHFIENEDKANKRCLKGLCIDPRARYQFDKEEERKIKAISNLQQEGAGFESVSGFVRR